MTGAKSTIYTPVALIGMLLGLAVLLLLAAGCRTAGHPTGLSPRPPANESAAQFVGSSACAGCHPQEFAQHQASSHARTLRTVTATAKGAALPPIGKIPNTAYSIECSSESLRFVHSDDASIGGRIQYVLGSGKTAVTYIGEIGKESLTEYRMSFDPAHRVWLTTPGQVESGDLKLGTVFELGMATRCILCHADKLAARTAEPAEGFSGVGCESCHGPAGAHVDSFRAGRGPGVAMEKLETLGAARIDALCARCHRSINDVALDQYDASNTARFQPYSLELSPCFKKSSNRLSCITCHNPHSDASRQTRDYVKVCLSCHSADASTHGTVCPVNPKEKCVGCHMPERSIFPAAHVPLSIADHFIWAYRAHKADKTGAQPVH